MNKKTTQHIKNELTK